jgi:hypothetical protein
MPCERYRDALTDAAAGEAVTPGLAAHLEDCAACRSELDELRRLMAAADEELSVLATAEPSPALRVRLREAVAEAGPAPAWRWSFAWTLAAAAVVAVAALGVWRSVAGRAPAGIPMAQATPPPAFAGSAPRRGTATAFPAVSAVSSTGPGESAVAAPDVRRPSSDRPGPVRAARRAEPEVLVPPGGEAELLRYVWLVHREGLPAPALSAAGEPSAALAELSPIDVRPLEIVPLDPGQESGT